ncbi:MAG: RICIN domain-containing protein [Clostridiales bacterium]|nr:RICIN domain-containing protein [Clostridiales bacterium]
MAEGTYRIINGSGRSLSVLTGSSTANPKSTQNVCLYDWDSRDPAERWTLRRVGDNVFEILTPANNVILNAYSDSPKHGTNVNVYGNDGSNTQRWFIEQSGDKFIIRLQSNRNLVLTATGSGNEANVNVSNYDSNNNNQKWSLNKL